MKRIYSFRFDEELIKKIDEIAKKEFRNRNNMVEVILKKFIKQNEKSKKL